MTGTPVFTADAPTLWDSAGAAPAEKIDGEHYTRPPMPLPFSPNRAAHEARRAQLAARLGNRPALIAAGLPRPRNYAANLYPYRASSHFLYLFGLPLRGAVTIYDGAAFLRTLRLNCLTRDYAPLWEELFDPVWRDDAWADPESDQSPLGDVLVTARSPSLVRAQAYGRLRS